MKVSAVFERLSTFEVDRVARYLKSGEKQFQIEAAKLVEENKSLERKQFANEDDYEAYTEVLGSNYTILEDIKGLTEELAIVALYRIVELNIRKILLWRYPKEEVGKLKRIDRISQRLSTLTLHKNEQIQ